MSMLSSLEAAEVSSWLTRLAQTLDRGIREPVRSEIAARLMVGVDGPRLAFPVLAQLALLDDCLRVAHLAIEADGRTDADELARVSGLVRVAAEKYFAALPSYEAFADGATSSVECERFIRTHRQDAGVFGFASPTTWRGLQLARDVERLTRNASPLRDHERMLSRIMDDVFGGRATEVERDARRKLRAMFEPPAAVGQDPRAVAFCRNDGPEVFASVAHGSQIHERDPYDVESIHAEARDAFHRIVDRATTPEQHLGKQGRTLLVLGESGCGKTHLLRALRTQVHSRRLGYVGYMQMTAEVGDYSRYVLRKLVDSMEHPYDAPTASESALMYLSDGLAEGRVAIPAEELNRLRTAELTEGELDEVIGRIVDRIVRTDGLERLETDLLHALLLLQRKDPALQRRVIRFLRCEPLTAYDRKLLGGLNAREQPEDPLRTIQQLATIMYELQMAALVIVVDQIEETVPDGQTVTRLQQAFDSLRAISDAIPSSVVAISCLDDVYTAVRPKLTRSLVDRLELDPAPVRLSGQRGLDEIEQMLVRRLEHLYATFDVPWREDEPLFPFTAEHVQAVDKFRARDCLARFRQYHSECIKNGSLVERTSPNEQLAEPPAAPGESASRANLERMWNDIRSSIGAPPDDDREILKLVEEAVQCAAADAGIAVVTRAAADGLTLHVEGPTLAKRCASLCNRQPQGGHLGKQLAALAKLPAQGIQPFALRSSDFQFKGKVISQQLAEYLQAGGQRTVIQEAELRAVLALRQLQAANPSGLATWRKTRQPLAELALVRALLDLDAHPAPAPTPPAHVPPAAVPPAPSALSRSPLPAAGTPKQAPAPAPSPIHSGVIPVFDPERLRLGVSTSMRADPQYVALEQVKTHITFVGGTGSGKTTAALHVIEQLLERGVSAILLDRKGDLARYASETWWRDANSQEHARRTALRERIDVALYTPGNSQGRPLRLPLIPSLGGTTPQEREQLAQFAANGLGAMMGYGTNATHRAKLSVLQCAIQLHHAEREITLDLLLDTINRPDPELLQAVASLQRHFATLSEDLQALRIQRGSLLVGDGEVVDVAALLPPSGGRPRLSIINTSALGDVSVLQFWVSRLLIELTRLSRKRPSKTLQGVAFFDEADIYVPAVSSPPTKEPMFDLLRRARSGGIGVLLATQNPGDFDYKARDNIGTWLVGKVAQDRAIEKMRNLIGAYPNVGPRLATQPTGHFFVLASGKAVEVRCDRALMQTEQLAETEVLELARGAATAERPAV